MTWEVEYTDEFEAWWQEDLSESEQDEIAAIVGLLERKGPHLPYPYSSGIGGRKTGSDRWYQEFVPLADRLYDEHLNQLRKEGRMP